MLTTEHTNESMDEEGRKKYRRVANYVFISLSKFIILEIFYPCIKTND